MQTIPPADGVNVTLLSHSPKTVENYTDCRLQIQLPTHPTAAYNTAAAPTPSTVQLALSGGNLPAPVTLPISRECTANFPPDGSIVVPLGSSSSDVQTAIITAVDRQTAQRLVQDFRRVLEGSSRNVFDAKTEASSSQMYFHYYGTLQHQQNMLQDMTRTGTYYWAIMNNRQDFEGKVVVDVGAGTGILSLFAAQAGARQVYAVEASDMVTFAQKLFDGNAAAGSRVRTLHGKAEALVDALPEKADLLISEPMGTLLVNERMLETYIFARKHMLKPGGLMFPSLGRIFTAAFADAALFSELQGLAAFWMNPSFYGVDLTALHGDALEGYCGKVVIDAFDPGILMSPYTTYPIDFMTAEETDLHDICIPLSLVCHGPGVVHGIACWFDVQFPGTAQAMWLSTAPGMAATHWFQLRCVLRTPITIFTDGQLITGTLRLKAHAAQSYDVHLSLESVGGPSGGPPADGGPPGGAPPQSSRGVFDLKDPYYRQLRVAWGGGE